MQTWGDDHVRMAHWAKLRSFAQALTEIYKALGQASILKPPEPPLRHQHQHAFQHLGTSMHSHSEYLEKLRKGVKGNMALFAFDVQAKARRAREEAQQLIEVGGVVTCVEDVADLENVAYWQQGDAAFSTKERMAERQALRYHPRVLGALQMYWEAAQRSLHSGGDLSANELHQEGHHLMLR